MSHYWGQKGEDIDGETEHDWSGISLSINSNGSIVAIGAVNNDGNGNSSGHVRVYKYWNTSSSWTQLGGDIDGEGQDNYSGHSVSLSSDGMIVAIGAYGNNDSFLFGGHVRVYEYSNRYCSWIQMGGDIDGQSEIELSGWDVSLSDDGLRVAVGSKYNSSNGSQSGCVRIYEYSNSYWTQLGNDIYGENAYDELGTCVSLNSDGSIIAIGAPNNNGNGSNSGQVRVYEYSNSSWTQLGSDIYGESASVHLGYDVSLSSDGLTVAIGVPYSAVSTTNSGALQFFGGSAGKEGHVSVYEYSNSSWTQLGSNIIVGVFSGYTGWSLSLSSDGLTVSVGSIAGSSNLRVYEYSNNSWIQKGQDIHAEKTDDRSGWCVSISSDASTIAMGSFLRDDGGTDSGEVRIFKYVIPINYDTTVYLQTDKSVWGSTFNFQMVENSNEPKFKYNNIDILSISDGYNNSESSYSSNKIVDVNSNAMKTILRELAKYVFGSPNSCLLYTSPSPRD